MHWRCANGRVLGSRRLGETDIGRKKRSVCADFSARNKLPLPACRTRASQAVARSLLILAYRSHDGLVGIKSGQREWVNCHVIYCVLLTGEGIKVRTFSRCANLTASCSYAMLGVRCPAGFASVIRYIYERLSAYLAGGAFISF